MKAKALKPGDKIGIFTPSTPAPVLFPERYERGVRCLEQLGFVIVEGRNTTKRQAYRSASVRERADELNELIHNDEVKAVISTIGGTNANSLLPYIDYDHLRKHPKAVIGYSDVTAILLAIYAKIGLTAFYGPAVVPSFGEFPAMLPKGKAYFKDILLREKLAPYKLDVPEKWTDEMIDWRTQDRPKKMVKNGGWRCLKSGKAQGKLIGGNLNTMTGFLASDYFPNVEGAVFFIEDSAKDMATEERLFSMLKLAGVFDKISGLVVGKHEQFNDLGAPFMLDDLLLEIVGDYDFPILSNVDVGHTFPSHVFPIGIEVELNAVDGSITFLEDGVDK